jgi:hypothetical protein
MMRFVVTQLENLLLLAIGFSLGWYLVASLPGQITVASCPRWLPAAALATVLLALGGRFVFDGTFQALGIGLMLSSSAAATLLIYEVIR